MAETRLVGPAMKRDLDTTMPVAVAVDMFSNGLGIARILGKRAVRAIGLSAHHDIYGHFTRHANIRSCPDSRVVSEGLLKFLIRVGEEIGECAIIYPMRDDVLYKEHRPIEIDPQFDRAFPRRCANRLAGANPLPLTGISLGAACRRLGPNFLRCLQPASSMEQNTAL